MSKTTKEKLNDLIKDAKPFLGKLGDFRFHELGFDLSLQEAAPFPSKWLDTGFSIVEEEGNYTVCLAVVVKGCYRTKNGDGWPDEVDIQELTATTSLYEAFGSLMGTYFRMTLAACIQVSQETQMMDADDLATKGHDQ